MKTSSIFMVKEKPTTELLKTLKKRYKKCKTNYWELEI